MNSLPGLRNGGLLVQIRFEIELMEGETNLRLGMKWSGTIREPRGLVRGEVLLRPNEKTQIAEDGFSWYRNSF